MWLGLPRSDALSDPILTPPLFLPSCEEVLPVGIIAGATIGAGILLIFFFIALVFFLYRRRKGSKYGSSAGHSPLPSGVQQAVPGRGEGVGHCASQARWVQKQRLAENIQALPLS